MHSGGPGRISAFAKSITADTWPRAGPDGSYGCGEMWQAAVRILRSRYGDIEKTLQQVEREWKDDGAVLFSRDFCQCLQVAQLQRRWLTADHRRGVRQLLTGSEFALGMDDLRPLLALGLRLARHCSLHRLG